MSLPVRQRQLCHVEDTNKSQKSVDQGGVIELERLAIESEMHNTTDKINLKDVMKDLARLVRDKPHEDLSRVADVCPAEWEQDFSVEMAEVKTSNKSKEKPSE